MHIVDLLSNRRREKTTMAVCAVAALELMLLPQSTKLSFAKRILSAAYLPAGRMTHFLDDFKEVRAENRRLKRIVASLAIERERLLQFRDERERLRRFAAFKEEQFYRLLPCEVIGRNVDRFRTVLVLDKGANDAMKKRMPVLSYEGYVGCITEVFPSSSHVQLIVSRNNPVSCIDKRSRVVGILEWKNHSAFELKNVGIVEDVEVGDTLITSGFGGVVPKGFPVAIVSKVSKAVDGLSLKIDARSHIKFRSLEEVFVILDRIPWDRGILFDPLDQQLYENAVRSETPEADDRQVEADGAQPEADTMRVEADSVQAEMEQ
ncbi:MAG: rod shape-determining protein MreC [Chitinivibrionia bacterium]|nr:rod shape-determining protein MreC [Chitinivibrionia bacterium]